MFYMIFRYWKMDEDCEVGNMEDMVFDITITGPYPDLDLCDIPGLNNSKIDRRDQCRAIMER